MNALKKELGLFPSRENNALYQETLRIARMGKRCLKNLDEGDAKELAYNLERLADFTISLQRVTNEFIKELKAVRKKQEGVTNVVGIRSRLGS